MEFTLKYRGSIPPVSSRESRLAEKHAMRRAFHEQLGTLWASDPRLSKIDPKTLQFPIVTGAKCDVPRPINGEDRFFYRRQLGGFDFVPLVNTPIEAHCHLAIRLHHPSGPGNIVIPAGGDLDNRLKTIFDALRMPTSVEELGGITPTSPDETCFCLLENDSLITKLSVESRRLLGRNPPDASYAEVDIDVTVRAVTPMMGTLALLFP